MRQHRGKVEQYEPEALGDRVAEATADPRKRGFRIARTTFGIGVKFDLPPVFGTGEAEVKHLTKNGRAYTARCKPKHRAVKQEL